MTPKQPIQSSGIGRRPVLAFSPEGIAMLQSAFPKKGYLALQGWASFFRLVDLGEMDLSQWPPRPVSLTATPAGSKSDK